MTITWEVLYHYMVSRCVLVVHIEVDIADASACPKLSKKGVTALCGHSLDISDCLLQQCLPCTLEGCRAMLYDYDLWLEEDAAHDSTTRLDGQVFNWGHARCEGYCNSPAHFHGGQAPLGRAVLQGPLWQPQTDLVHGCHQNVQADLGSLLSHLHTYMQGVMPHCSYTYCNLE
jgi:hypothetical protein